MHSSIAMSALAIPTPLSIEEARRHSEMVPKGARKRILVVDADPSSRSVLSETLSARWDVYEAWDGLEALKVARLMPTPSLVITEVSLPTIDGFKLAKLLKLHPELREVAIMFVSERASQADLVAGIKAGARRYLAKPFVRETLFDVVARILDR
jgi:CheY-like chemotaxis protein